MHRANLLTLPTPDTSDSVDSRDSRRSPPPWVNNIDGGNNTGPKTFRPACSCSTGTRTGCFYRVNRVSEPIGRQNENKLRHAMRDDAIRMREINELVNILTTCSFIATGGLYE
uniref:Uncharacterized protein n=1 Tax=Lotharella globosa TaxID=91324 RepID=A0A7S4E086_9EUKA